MKLQKLARPLSFACGALVFAGAANASDGLPETVAPAVVERHRTLMLELGNERRTVLDRDFPQHHAIASCKGSFNQPGNKDRFLALWDAKTRRMNFVAILEGKVVLKVAEFPNVESKQALAWTSVDCFSPSDVRSLNRSIAASGGLHHGRIKEAGKFDIACIGSPADPVEHSCFTYSRTAGKFIDAGGWTN